MVREGTWRGEQDARNSYSLEKEPNRTTGVDMIMLRRLHTIGFAVDKTPVY